MPGWDNRRELAARFKRTGVALAFMASATNVVEAFRAATASIYAVLSVTGERANRITDESYPSSSLPAKWVSLKRPDRTRSATPQMR